MKFKITTIYPAIFIISFVIFNCSKDKIENNASIIHEEIRGECQTILYAPPETNSGYLVLEVHGNDLHILHNEAYYQCCLGYVVEYEIDAFDILAAETDTADLCRCDCFFDLCSILYDLESGMYSVTLIGIESDTVGVDSAMVGG